VSDGADLDDAIDESLEVVRGAGDADRGDAHGGAVRVTGAAGLGGGDARADRLDRASRRRAQEIRRAAGPHALLPGEQALGERARFDPSAARHEEPPEEHRLLGVVRDGARGQPGGDRMIPVRCLEPGEQGSPPSDDLGARERLGGHAQRVADGQSP
jgi:hypothetical protein